MATGYLGSHLAAEGIADAGGKIGGRGVRQRGKGPQRVRQAWRLEVSHLRRKARLREGFLPTLLPGPTTLRRCGQKLYMRAFRTAQ